jgi:hypothetical protein
MTRLHPCFIEWVATSPWQALEHVWFDGHGNVGEVVDQWQGERLRFFTRLRVPRSSPWFFRLHARAPGQDKRRSSSARIKEPQLDPATGPRPRPRCHGWLCIRMRTMCNNVGSELPHQGGPRQCSRRGGIGGHTLRPRKGCSDSDMGLHRARGQHALGSWRRPQPSKRLAWHCVACSVCDRHVSHHQAKYISHSLPSHHGRGLGELDLACGLYSVGPDVCLRGSTPLLLARLGGVDLPAPHVLGTWTTALPPHPALFVGVVDSPSLCPASFDQSAMTLGVVRGDLVARCRIG